MTFPRINCNTTTVTVLAATAATTLSLRVTQFLYHVLCLGITITRRRRRVPSTMSTFPCSSARASLVSLVETHLAKPPSQDRLDGRVCPRNDLSQGKRTPSVREVCWEIVKTIGGTVPRPIKRPADHRQHGHAHGSGRVHGRASLGLDDAGCRRARG